MGFGWITFLMIIPGAVIIAISGIGLSWIAPLAFVGVGVGIVWIVVALAVLYSLECYISGSFIHLCHSRRVGTRT